MLRFVVKAALTFGGITAVYIVLSEPSEHVWKNSYREYEIHDKE